MPKNGNCEAFVEKGSNACPKCGPRSPRLYSKAQRIRRALVLLFWLVLGVTILTLSSDYIGGAGESGEMVPWL